MKTQITKEVTFDMAHRLSFHKGLCRNLHGHTYRLQVTINTDNYFVDFADLQKRIHERVTSLLDHATLLSKDESNIELIKVLESMGMKVHVTEWEPIAENMVRMIATHLNMFDIVCIRLWETPTSFVEYYPEREEKKDE